MKSSPLASVQPTEGRLGRVLGALLDHATGAEPARSHLSSAHTPEAHMSGDVQSRLGFPDLRHNQVVRVG